MPLCLLLVKVLLAKIRKANLPLRFWMIFFLIIATNHNFALKQITKHARAQSAFTQFQHERAESKTADI